MCLSRKWVYYICIVFNVILTYLNKYYVFNQRIQDRIKFSKR
jgi:hypothetical protein